MAMTLLQFWQQELATYQGEETAAKSDLADAQQKVADAAKNVLAAQQALAKYVSDIATARAQLGVTTIPADANALIVKITGLIVGQRGAQGTLLDRQDDLAAAKASVDAAGATLARASARVAAAQAGLATAKADDARRQGYKTALGQPPLKTLKDDATAFLASDTVTHATTRLGKNFPAEIRTVAGKRRDTRVKRLQSLQKDLENAQDALGTERATDGGLDGTVAQKQIAFQRAQRALGLYVATAADRSGKAKVVMAALEAIEVDTTGAVPDVLTDAAKAQLTGPAAATGAAAEPTAEILDTDLNAVFTAADDLDAQILTSIAANVDGLATDPTIATKRTAIDTARNTFIGALTTFAAANKKDLDQWEAIIPDPAWQVLLEYENGKAALDELSSVDPGALATAMDAAEDAYASAVTTAAVARRKADYLGDAIALRQKRLDGAQAAITSRLLSAIRGDSY